MGHCGKKARNSLKQTKSLRISDMNFKFIKLVVALVIFSSVSCAYASDVLVEFAGNEKITKSDLKSYISTRLDLIGRVRTVGEVSGALKEMAFTRVLILEGSEGGVTNKSMAPLSRFDDAYAFDVYKKIASPCIELDSVSEQEQFFKEYPELFRAPATVRLQRFMLPIQASVNGISALSLMKSWREEWQRNQITLDQIGSKVSEIFNLEVQGDVGWIALSPDVSVMNTVAQAGKREMVGPLIEGDFVYLFFIENKQESKQLTWEEIGAEVKNISLSHCRKNNKDKLKKQLFEKYNVIFVERNIVKYFE